jgi:hypothetical protein
MNFIIKFEKNLREELNYNCVDHKTEFILFYFYTKGILGNEIYQINLPLAIGQPLLGGLSFQPIH